MSRIYDKIKEIAQLLEELETLLPKSFEEYKLDYGKRAACERFFEKIIEAVVGLAFLVIKDKNLKSPEEDKQAFNILAEEKIISSRLSDKLKDAKSMRNILAHEYGKVDDELVFDALTRQLIEDVLEFIENIKELR